MSSDKSVSSARALFNTLTKFTGEYIDFPLWKTNVLLAMSCQPDGLINEIYDSSNALRSHDYRSTHYKKSQACYLIFNAMTPSVQVFFQHLIPNNDAATLWTHICSKYERGTSYHKSKLMTEISQFKMKSDERMDTYILRLSTLVNDLKKVDLEIGNDLHKQYLINGLPVTYSATIDHIKVNEGTLSLDDMEKILKDKYEQMKDEHDRVETEEKANLVNRHQFNGRRPFRGRGGFNNSYNNRFHPYNQSTQNNNQFRSNNFRGRGRGGFHSNRPFNNYNNYNNNNNNNNNSNGPPQQQPREDIKCHQCGGIGHVKAQCPSPYPSQKSNMRAFQAQSTEANYSNRDSTNSHEEPLLNSQQSH